MEITTVQISQELSKQLDELKIKQQFRLSKTWLVEQAIKFALKRPLTVFGLGNE